MPNCGGVLTDFASNCNKTGQLILQHFDLNYFSNDARNAHTGLMVTQVLRGVHCFIQHHFKWNMSETNLFMSNWPSQWQRNKLDGNSADTAFSEKKQHQYP